MMQATGSQHQTLREICLDLPWHLDELLWKHP